MSIASKIRGWFRRGAPQAASDIPAPLPGVGPAKRRSDKWHAEFWRAMMGHAAITRAQKKRPVLKSASYRLPQPAPGVIPSGGKTMAMDSAISDAYSFAGESEWYGNGFVGYALLSELVQIPEFRIPCEVLAEEMTRKWGKVTYASSDDGDKEAAISGAEKVRLLEKAIKDFNVQEHFRWGFEKDGQFGRGALFLDLGQHDGPEIATPFDARLKVKKGGFKGLKRVEPIWMYPEYYDSLNPMSDDFYNPRTWYVMTQKVHRTRFLSFNSRPLPDLLKPAYLFGGQSLIQMMWVVVENWMRTRASVSELVNAFSVMVLETDLSQNMQPAEAAAALAARVQVFNDLRDNGGTFVLNKATESFQNVSAPLAGLHELQAQSQEHMCLPAGAMIETDRGQVPIIDVRLTDKVLTRKGFAPIKWVGVTDRRDTLVRIEAGSSVLMVTEEHPVWVESIGEFVSANCVNNSHFLLALSSQGNMDLPSHGAVAGGGRQSSVTTATRRQADFFIASFGKRIEAQFQKGLSFITEMMMEQTIAGTISGFSAGLSTPLSTSAWGRTSSPSGTPNCARYVARNILLNWLGGVRNIARRPATNGRGTLGTADCPAGIISPANARRAVRPSCPSSQAQDFALVRACSAPVTTVSRVSVPLQPVYNIEVEDGWPSEFFADGLLVHNSAICLVPLVILFGISPSGLNASSEGEIQVFYARIESLLERVGTPNMNALLPVLQMHLFGEIDDAIGWQWNPLWAMSEKERAEILKSKADYFGALLDRGAFSATEVRTAIAGDEDSPFFGIDADEVPEQPHDPEAEGDPMNEPDADVPEGEHGIHGGADQ